MTKEEFFARVDKAKEEIKQGEGIRFSDPVTMTEWLNSLWLLMRFEEILIWKQHSGRVTSDLKRFVKRRFYGHQGTIEDLNSFLPSIRFKNTFEKQSTKELNYKRFLYHFSSFDAVPEGDLAVLFPFIC